MPVAIALFVLTALLNVSCARTPKETIHQHLDAISGATRLH